MSGYKIESERKDVTPSIYINSDGKVYVDRSDENGGGLHNNSGDNRYDSATYSFDRTGKLKITTAEGYTYDVKEGTVPVATPPVPPVPKVEDTGGGGEGGEINPADLWKMMSGWGSGGVNAISYSDYLTNYGVDTKKAYSEAVRQANSDYYRTLMTYGKNAEALAGNGLTGGGVSDYGNAAAYAARQGAVATAGAAKLETDAKQAASYAEYLQQAQAQARAEEAQMNANRNNFIMSLMSYGVTDPEQIESLARQSGYFSEDQLAEFVKFAEDYSTTAGAANQADADALYSELVAGGMAPDAAKAQVVQKYGDDIAQTAQDNVAKITTTHDNAGVDTMLTGNYSPFNEENSYTVDYFKKQVAAGAISEEEAQKQIDKIEQANLKWIEGQLGDANNAYKVDAILAYYGLDAEYAAASNEEKITAATNAVNADLEKLVTSGELSEEKAAGYYADYFDMNFDPEENIEDVLMTLSSFKGVTGYLENGDAIYQEALQKVANCIKMDTLVNTQYEQAVAELGANMFVKMNMHRTSSKAVEGQAKIGSFEQNGRIFTVYENGCFSVDGASSKTIYYDGVVPNKVGNIMLQHSVEKELSPIVQEIFTQWLRIQCGVA